MVNSLLLPHSPHQFHEVLRLGIVSIFHKKKVRIREDKAIGMVFGTTVIEAHLS